MLNEEVNIKYIESFDVGVNCCDLILYRDKESCETPWFMLSNIKKLTGMKISTSKIASEIRNEFLMDGEKSVDGLIKHPKSWDDPTNTSRFNSDTFFISIDILEWLLVDHLDADDLFEAIESRLV